MGVWFGVCNVWIVRVLSVSVLLLLMSWLNW